MTDFSYFPLSTIPAPYDIVWCRFPAHDALGDPGPKPRPAIVLNCALDNDAGEGEVQLVYGTSKLKFDRRPRDFFVTNLAEMDACGLHLATRFDLDNIAWIPWAKEWFSVIAGYQSPVIGHLTPHQQKLLELELMHRRSSELKSTD